MQIQPILSYFWAILGLYQATWPPILDLAPPPFFFTYPGSAPVLLLKMHVSVGSITSEIRVFCLKWLGVARLLFTLLCPYFVYELLHSFYPLSIPTIHLD